MRFGGYLWAIAPFSKVGVGWPWNIATLGAAVIAPSIVSLTTDQISNLQIWLIWSFGVFVILRFVLVAPYLAWAKLADEADVMRAQLGVAHVREEKMECISKLSVLNPTDDKWTEVCTRIYQLSPRFSNLEIHGKIENFCSDASSLSYEMMEPKARELIGWIRNNAN